MHYRRIDPQPSHLAVVTDPPTPTQSNGNVGRPEDMPNAELVKVAGEWYWRRQTAKDSCV